MKGKHLMGLGRSLPKEVDVRTCFSLLPPPIVDWCDVARVTIDVLPDLALLEIFNFCVDDVHDMLDLIYEDIDAWHTLVHVCRKWRNVVFGSPRRLHLRLHCRASTQVKTKLTVWPRLPIVVRGTGWRQWGKYNIIAALEHNDRICQVYLGDMPAFKGHAERVLAAMQQPFPALTDLYLRYMFSDVVIPDSFLGGSAPGLRSFYLYHIPFPGLPKLLLSTTHLVRLRLAGIRHSGYISPEAMVSCLSGLTRLEDLLIGFESPQSRPDRQRPPPPTRTLLPVLTRLQFKGVDEYMEDLVARIDAPQLNYLEITFFNQLLFHTPQLTQFITRIPRFKTDYRAIMFFSSADVSILLPQSPEEGLKLGILSRQSDWQLSSLAQVCSSCFPQDFIPVVERLIIGGESPYWQDDIENSQWLELFHIFNTVENLYVTRDFVPRIAPALQELVGERVTEVLPALKNLVLEDTLPSGPVPEAIGAFVAARQLADYPIDVRPWDLGWENDN